MSPDTAMVLILTDQRAEVERLRAEVERLRAEVERLSREDS